MRDAATARTGDGRRRDERADPAPKMLPSAMVELYDEQRLVTVDGIRNRP